MRENGPSDRAERGRVVAFDRDPSLFRDHVAAVAAGRDPGVSLDEIADDFGISVGTIEEWMPGRMPDDASAPADGSATTSECLDLVERVRALEREEALLQQIVERIAPLDR